jgi:hypothetical protein
MPYGKRSSRQRPHDAAYSSRAPSVERQRPRPCRPLGTRRRCANGASGPRRRTRPHARQFAGPMQPRQRSRIPSIRFDPPARPFRNQSRSDNHAFVARALGFGDKAHIPLVRFKADMQPVVSICQSLDRPLVSCGRGPSGVLPAGLRRARELFSDSLPSRNGRPGEIRGSCSRRAAVLPTAAECYDRATVPGSVHVRSPAPARPHARPAPVESSRGRPSEPMHVLRRQPNRSGRRMRRQRRSNPVASRSLPGVHC